MKHTIATLGSHSALDVCEGAMQEGFSTLVAAQKGREKTYLGYYRKRKRGKGKNAETVGVIDEVLLLNKFSEIVKAEKINFMKKRNCIFVPNRSFSVYVGYDAIENTNTFPIPIFGNRYLLRAEERDAPKNQYYLLDKARIRYPKTISSPDKIDRLSIVKVSEAKRSYERAFFVADSYSSYQYESRKLLEAGIINAESLAKARIEEFVIGAQFNLNFFYSPVHEELELLGIDTRRQTNIDGLIRMTADLQTKALKYARQTNIEVGHIACTLRESLLEQAFDLGERFVDAVQKEPKYKAGLIGPFALQCAITEEDGKEDFVCFDVSFRMPGSPGTRFTPYSEYLFGKSVSFGRRIAMEIKKAEREKMIEKVAT